MLDRDLDAVLERIAADVERLNPGIVVVDSFRSVFQGADGRATEMELQHFVQRLALRLTSWEATTFLIGEFSDGESRDPAFTVADGVIWLTNEGERNSSVRKLRVTKLRGQAAQPGLHTLRITDRGVGSLSAARPARDVGEARAGVGALLDRLLSVSYVRAVERDGQTFYRAAPRSLE